MKASLYRLMAGFLIACCGAGVTRGGEGITGLGTICNDLLITEEDVHGVHVSDGIACLAMGHRGLQLVDVSDPAQPVLLGRFETPFSGTASVDRVGDVAFISDAFYGMKCIDVSDPMNLVLLGALEFPNPVNDIVVRNGLAYLTDSFLDGGLRIIDVSDPTSPMQIGSLLTDWMAISMLLDGPYVYLMEGPHGFTVVDVSDPTDPVEVGSRPSRGGWTTTIELHGDYAFVVEHDWIVTYDISDPTNPIELELVEHSGYLGIHDLQVHLGTLWAAQGGYPGNIAPFAIFDAELFELNPIELSGEANQIVFTENAVYVAQSDFGIVDLPPDEWNGVPGLNIITDFSGCSACPADLTLDGVLDFFDISEFLHAFSRSRIEADFTQDGVIDFFDISAFLQAFGAGCP